MQASRCWALLPALRLYSVPPHEAPQSYNLTLDRAGGSHLAGGKKGEFGVLAACLKDLAFGA